MLRQFAKFSKLHLFFAVLLTGFITVANAQGTFRVGIAGLNHDHIYNILNDYSKGKVKIVGIAEPDKQLQEKIRKAISLA